MCKRKETTIQCVISSSARLFKHRCECRRILPSSFRPPSQPSPAHAQPSPASPSLSPPVRLTNSGPFRCRNQRTIDEANHLSHDSLRSAKLMHFTEGSAQSEMMRYHQHQCFDPRCDDHQSPFGSLRRNKKYSASLFVLIACRTRIPQENGNGNRICSVPKAKA